VSDTNYVTLEELAAHVGVKVSTIRQWVKRGFIPRSTYIKAGNTYRFCVADVVAELRKEEPKSKYETADRSATNDLREGKDERPKRGVVTREMLEDFVSTHGEEKKPDEEDSIEEMLSELDDDF
jgi:excisionase family DNA binding protein